LTGPLKVKPTGHPKAGAWVRRGQGDETAGTVERVETVETVETAIQSIRS
jgi:hypothetical protein